MNAALSTVLNLSVIVFAATSMLSVGLGSTLKQGSGTAPERAAGGVRTARQLRAGPTARVCRDPLMPLERPHALGLFLIGTAAGAPFLIKLIEAAEGRVARGATLLVLLLAGRTV